ncbi:hypothetical protein E0500_026015 [Streptomyces sp. KM273126]|uniref:hypothetical protein n=1 Tax=Streptomyces sp. KM273126 TaxID=2545247 RepID=UPI00103C5508|nr:hypothetical protein [Streptomyces sp. KM273126]MBA2810757.1 hypothetical protein [Streptomyces sp. KM273126]
MLGRSERCERVPIRPEKKLVRAQLSWLDRRIRLDPARAARLLADVAPAFAEPWWTPDRSGVVLDPPLPPAAAALVGPYRGQEDLLRKADRTTSGWRNCRTTARRCRHVTTSERAVRGAACTAACTGAPATVWSVLDAALPGLLRDLLC